MVRLRHWIAIIPALPLVIVLAVGTQVVLFMPELPGRWNLIIKTGWLVVAAGLIVYKGWRAIIERRHLLAARLGLRSAAAPAGYIKWLFDDYAARYDDDLTGQLGYRVPGLLRDMVAGSVTGDQLTVVDLGCGTGLSGPLFRDLASTLVGVDLSSRMLAQARRRGVYDHLVEADVVEFFAGHPDNFDLCLAADVLVYMGDLSPLFSAVAAALEPGGHFAFSVESLAKGDWALGRSARYAHGHEYLREVARYSGLEVVDSRAVVLRTEKDQPVSGEIWLLRR